MDDHEGVDLDSEIISEIPDIFSDFKGKTWQLLWRGSRDGFGAGDFHNRCDGHANTVTLIETAASEHDAGGFVLGGFATVEWDSTSNWKSDGSLKSFLFTLKNPHNIPARKFALMADQKDVAIFCDSERGPCFGEDMAVADNCNANTDSYTSLGWAYGNCNANTESRTNFGDAYANDTGRDGRTVFTGSRTFKVKEIEVFEITD
jgi:hypothetical protein